MKYKFKLVDIVLILMILVIIDDFKSKIFIDILLDILVFINSTADKTILSLLDNWLDGVPNGFCS